MNLTQQKLEDARKALKTLEEVLAGTYSVVARDAAIQRFEYTVEAVWKCLQLYLRENEGIDCYSPKGCFREAKNAGLLTEDETVRGLEMIDDRNLTSHSYHQEVAEKIYKKIPSYSTLMKSLLEGMKK